MLKKVVLALLAIGALAAAGAYLLPRYVPVERSIVIERPAIHLYTILNSFERFNDWSPWFAKDPNAQYERSGPAVGIGAKHSWAGNDDVGVGSSEIVDNIGNRRIDVRLDFEGMNPSMYYFELLPEANGTRVTWHVDADMGNNPIGRYLGLKMDDWIGGDYELGLQQLKTLVEGFPNVDFTGLAVEPVTLSARPLIALTGTSAVDDGAIGAAYATAYGTLVEAIQREGMQMNGQPLVRVEPSDDASVYAYTAAIPVEPKEEAQLEGIERFDSYAGPALRAIHTGPYSGLDSAAEKLSAYANVRGLEPSERLMFVWLDDPTSVPAESVRTEILLPIKTRL